MNNISIGGWMPAPYGTAYTASKYGVRGMVETLQGEVSDYPDIHICALYPGFQKSSGIEHAANYSGIKLSTPPLHLIPANWLLLLWKRPRILKMFPIRTGLPLPLKIFTKCFRCRPLYFFCRNAAGFKESP